MNKISKLFVLAAIISIFSLCKKKTDVKFIVFNPTNNTYKADVTVNIHKEHLFRISGKSLAANALLLIFHF